MKTALSIIRSRCNYTQSMVAKELGVSRQMIHTWECGEKTVPLARVQELAKLFGVTAEMLMNQDIEQVEEWSDRPLFSTEKNGRQVFSFSPTDELRVVLTDPNGPMPNVRCRELISDRNQVFQMLYQLIGFQPGSQADEIEYVESCLYSLMCMGKIFQTATQAQRQTQKQILDYLAEQISLVAQVLTDYTGNWKEPSQWQLQQSRQLRTHWAAITREQAKRRENLSLEPSPEKDDSPLKLEVMIERWYRRASQSGIGHSELQEYLNRMIREENYCESD